MAAETNAVCMGGPEPGRGEWRRRIWDLELRKGTRERVWYRVGRYQRLGETRVGAGHDDESDDKKDREGDSDNYGRQAVR